MTAALPATTATGRGHWRRLVLCALPLVLLAGGAIWWWQQLPPAPPEIPLDTLDGEVVDTFLEARAAVVQEPRSAAAWGKLGQAMLANDLYPEHSLTCFRAAQRFDPDDPRWPYLAAGCLLIQGKPKEALPNLERTILLCERAGLPAAPPRLQLVETLRIMGQTDAVPDHLQRVLAEDQHNARAHFILGLMAFARADWPACKSALEECLTSPYARQRACTRLAMVCQRLGDRTNAAYYAERAERLPKDLDWPDPFIAEYAPFKKRKSDRYLLVTYYASQGQFDRAIEVLEQMTKRYPDDYLTHLTLGKIVAQVNQFDRAEAELQTSLRLAPDKIEARHLLAAVYFGEGERLEKAGDKAKARDYFTKAVGSAREVVAQRPDYGATHLTLGLALKHLGRQSEAIAALRDAVHWSPEYPEVHLELGTAVAESGDLRDARPLLVEAARLAQPGDPRPAQAMKRFFPNDAGKSP